MASYQSKWPALIALMMVAVIAKQPAISLIAFNTQLAVASAETSKLLVTKLFVAEFGKLLAMAALLLSHILEPTPFAFKVDNRQVMAAS